MDSISKNLEKVGSSIYNLFDHLYIKIVIITILVVYNSGLFVDYNLYLSSVFNNTILRLIILFIIVAIAPKNITIALLLALTLAISSYYRAENFENNNADEYDEDKEDYSNKKKSNTNKQQPKQQPKNRK
jgi:hypothetical protein